MTRSRISVSLLMTIMIGSLTMGWPLPAPAIGTGEFVDSNQIIPMTMGYRVAVSYDEAYVADSSGAEGDTNWYSDGQGDFYATTGHPCLGRVVDVKLGDMNGDGYPDAVLALDYGTPTGGISAKVLLNDHAHHFVDSGQTFGPNNNTKQVHLGDLDGDGDLDIFLVRNNYKPCEIWLNDGSAHFTPGQKPTGSSAEVAALGDLNGDHKLDAFIKALPTSYPFRVPTVWLNDGTGHLTSTTLRMELKFPASPSVALGDLDGDGDLDAIIGSGLRTGSVPDLSEIWLNDGSGQFTKQGTFGDPDVCFIALGDVDGDGDQDAFCVTRAPSTSIKLWLNDGHANFTDSGRALAYQNAYALALADLDNDGDLDAFVVGNGPAKVFFNGPPHGLTASGWQLQTVDNAGLTGSHPSLALNNQQQPCIAYWDDTTLVHRYAFWDDVAWNIQQVVAPSLAVDVRPYWHGTLAMGADNLPRLACLYRNDVTHTLQLQYLVGNGYSWTNQLVALYLHGYRLSLALDSAGSPAIAYTADISPGSGEQAVVSRSGPSGWSTIFHQSNLSDLTMAADGAGVKHLIGDNAAGKLVYYRESGASFTPEVPGPSGTVPLIAVTRAGVVHVVYQVFSAGASGGEGYLGYLCRDAAGWHPEERVVSGTGSFSFSLALDNFDRPNVAYGDHKDLMLATRGAGGWAARQVARGLTDFAPADYPLSLKFDMTGQANIAVFRTGSFADLALLTEGPDWQVRRVETGLTGTMDRTSLALDVDTFYPRIAYCSRSEGLKLASWNGHAGNWAVEVVDPGAGNGREPSLQLDTPDRHPQISYYDAGARILRYASWNGSAWTREVVDNLGDVGRSSTLLLEPNPRIVYWDATGNRVKLADRTGGAWHVYANPQTVAAHANSGRPHAAEVNYYDALNNYHYGNAVSYLDAAGGKLRLALWDGAAWTDNVISTVTTTGALTQAIAYDYASGQIYVAFTDAGGRALKLAKRALSGSWSVESVNTTALAITDVSIFLQAGSYPAIAYTLSDGSLNLAHHYRPLYGWSVEPVGDTGAGARGGLSQLGGDRERIAYYYQGASGLELRLAFRSSTLDTDLFASALRPCPGSGGSSPAPGTVRKFAAISERLAGGKVPELDVLRGLRDAFAATPAGQKYIDLYYKYAPETGLMGVTDPVLLRDACALLENFQPGFQAFAEGRGFQTTVTQTMVDDTKRLLDRLAARGSSGLSQAIQAEYAKYHNLQDFVGLNFDQWAAKLGVPPPVPLKEVVLHYLLGKLLNPQGLDVNQDKYVNIGDLIKLINAPPTSP